MAEGFFGRWSQRKLAERQRTPPDKPQQAEVQVAVVRPSSRTHPEAAPAPAAVPAPATTDSPAGASDGDKSATRQTAAPAPTMQDVAALHEDSDYRPFITRAVQPEVRNAALKKMFSDPHFNVMDGLDTYIDDYSLPDPLPVAMMRKMASAQFLQLFDEDKQDKQDKQHADLAGGDRGAGVPREDANGAAPRAVAQSPALPDNDFGAMPNPNTGLTGPHDDDTDLRLQPDDAPGPARAGRGTA